MPECRSFSLHTLDVLHLVVVIHELARSGYA